MQFILWKSDGFCIYIIEGRLPRRKATRDNSINREDGNVNRYCFLLGLLFSLLTFTSTHAQKVWMEDTISSLQKPTGEPMATILNINKITMGVLADGNSNFIRCDTIPYTDEIDRWSILYPAGTAGIVYKDGVIWGGQVHDGQYPMIVRVGGSRYESSLRPGRIIDKGVAEDPDDPDVRIWCVRRDWQTADLRRDVVETYQISLDDVTDHQVHAVRRQYEKDWNEWPWEKGAPFYDRNGNGVMDNGEEPGLAYADQVVWFVANDLDRNVTLDFLGSLPIGLEVQVTLWAYNRISRGNYAQLNEALKNIVFKRVRLIYKGCSWTPDTVHIDSMYIGQWSDPDLGYMYDDLVGCDTLLDIGYGYNAEDIDVEYSRYGLHPPAAGYFFAQGPVIHSSDDCAYFDIKIKEGYSNLGMTAFIWLFTGAGFNNLSRFEETLKFYNALRGFLPIPYPSIYYPFPPGMIPNAFPLAGDPVTGTGHVDGLGWLYSFTPGDRRFLCSSGPFSMALGDTQEVIIALMGGLGADRLSSISVMKYNAKWARQLAQNHFEIGFPEEEESFSEPNNMPLDFILYPNYPNPFNSKTEICYDLPLTRHVRLDVYNMLGQEVNVLVDEVQEPGRYAIRWDGTDKRGNRVPSGVYVYRLEAGVWVWTRKMTLLE